jgi:superfamily II DNA helicase RecQ
MRCKIFTVPLEPAQALASEQRLNDFLKSTQVKRAFASLANQANGPIWSILLLYEEDTPAVPVSSPVPGPSISASSNREAINAPAPTAGTLTRSEVKSVIALKKWRADTAAMEGVPVYMVAQNKWLEEIVRIPVKTVDDLKKVGGFGEWRVQKYGRTIVEILGAASKPREEWTRSAYGASRA